MWHFRRRNPVSVIHSYSRHPRRTQVWMIPAHSGRLIFSTILSGYPDNGCSRAAHERLSCRIIELYGPYRSSLPARVWTSTSYVCTAPSDRAKIPRHQSSPDSKFNVTWPKFQSEVRRKWIDEAAGEWMGRDVRSDIVCVASLSRLWEFPRHEHHYRARDWNRVAGRKEERRTLCRACVELVELDLRRTRSLRHFNEDLTNFELFSSGKIGRSRTTNKINVSSLLLCLTNKSSNEALS